MSSASSVFSLKKNKKSFARGSFKKLRKSLTSAASSSFKLKRRSFISSSLPSDKDVDIDSTLKGVSDTSIGLAATFDSESSSEDQQNSTSSYMDLVKLVETQAFADDISVEASIDDGRDFEAYAKLQTSELLLNHSTTDMFSSPKKTKKNKKKKKSLINSAEAVYHGKNTRRKAIDDGDLIGMVLFTEPPSKPAVSLTKKNVKPALGCLALVILGLIGYIHNPANQVEKLPYGLISLPRYHKLAIQAAISASESSHSTSISTSQFEPTIEVLTVQPTIEDLSSELPIVEEVSATEPATFEEASSKDSPIQALIKGATPNLVC